MPYDIKLLDSCERGKSKIFYCLLISIYSIKYFLSQYFLKMTKSSKVLQNKSGSEQ